MADPEPRPAVFDPEQEPEKFLAAAKRRAASKSSWKKQGTFENVAHLAYWLYVFGKEDDALEACRFLGRYTFAGNFSLWTWVECTLALQARIARQRGHSEEAAECLQRIRAAGFVQSRLDGGLLDDKLENVQRKAAEKDRTGERDWALLALLELAVLLELGGSEKWPVAALEQEFQQVLARLRVLLEVA